MERQKKKSENENESRFCISVDETLRVNEQNVYRVQIKDSRLPR